MGRAEGFLAAHAVTTIHYLISRRLKEHEARQALDALLKLSAIAPVDGNILQDSGSRLRKLRHCRGRSSIRVSPDRDTRSKGFSPRARPGSDPNPSLGASPLI